MKWYELAAEQGNVGAQYLLGLRYETRKGVAQDYILVHVWSNLAEHNGSEEGRWARDRVATKLTSGNIATAQKLARECIRKEYKGC